MPIYEALEISGFNIIAPGLPQLELCRDQVIRYAHDSAVALGDALAAIDAADRSGPDALAARLYRRNAADPAANVLLDRAGQGSALNCQSIMLAFGHGNDKVLLTGDMQFAAPEVPGIEPHIEHLLDQAVAAGPYRCLKLPHHSAYNGIDAALWAQLGKPALLVHSGGSNDPSHPEPSILREFEAVDDEILFLRTDRNGLISIDLGASDEAISISRGDPDDFTANRRRRRREDDPELRLALPAVQPQVREAAPSPPPYRPSPEGERIEVLLVRLPLDHELRVGPDTIEVRRSATGQYRPSIASATTADDPKRRLASGRTIDGLLFVTDSAGLARNIGAAETAEVIALIRRDVELIDISGQADPLGAARNALGQGTFKGVVLVGGYDILPAQRVDVLGPELRARISPDDISYDPDDFIVWSDDGWGDLNGDGMADLPVSRIPDGRSAELVFAALTADGLAPEGAFGIRNEARPFAKEIYALIAQEEPLICAPLHVSELAKDAPARRHIYFMLHGDDRDASRFWGDDPTNRRVVEAINVSALPSSGLDVAFAGCCWGALSVLQRANRADTALAPRALEESLALSCLRAGARAFVGCTGVHYSPGEDGGFFGGPMHKAFWTEILEGKAPAEALFRARATYLRDTPHGRTAPFEVGIERKIYKQVHMSWLRVVKGG